MVGPTSPFAGSRSRGLGGLAKKAGPVGHVWGPAKWGLCGLIAGGLAG